MSRKNFIQLGRAIATMEFIRERGEFTQADYTEYLLSRGLTTINFAYFSLSIPANVGVYEIQKNRQVYYGVLNQTKIDDYIKYLRGEEE